MMLPNGDAQRDLIKSVYAEARLDPNDTPVVEAHGTGTAVGDPLEVGAIQQALRKPGGTGPPLLIGSVKPNVGHLESASGIVGLIKGVLMLEHRKVPATINIESLKPSLHLDDFNMAIPRQLQDWPSNTVQRLSLSNYGYGGTNAHLILESASEVIPSKSNVFNGLSSGMTNGKKSLSDGLKVISNGINGLSNGIKNLSNGVNGLSNGINNETVSELPESPLIVTLSAESANSIKKIAKDTRNWALNQSPSEDLLRNLAFTLASRRSAMRHRIAFPARTLQDVISGLEAVSSKEKPSLSPRLLFVFTGQGAQWHAMGRELMNIESPFRKSMQKSDSLLRIIGADWSLMEELSKNDSESRINESELAQSATCAIQMALVDLLEELGIRPHTVVGHSSGEIAAAYATRAVDQASALTIAWNRGMCTRGDQARKGAMLAVALGEDQAAPYLSQVKNGKAVIACANSPSSTTISGDSDAIAEIEVALKLDGIFARKLMVDRAYHSHHMQDSADNYMSRIKHLKLQAPAPEVIFVSSVTGESRSTVFTPQYWVDNLVSKVRFGDAISQALQIGASEESKSSSQVIIEIGPHNALAGPVRQILKSISTEDKSQLYSALARGKDSTETFASLASDLFIQGCQVKLDVFNTIIRPSQHPKVLSSLPPYAWNHSTKYWHESRSSKEHRFRKHAPHDLLGVQIPGVSSSRPSWRHILDVKRIPWLQEHVVNGEMIFPAAGYVSMVLEALRQISTGSEKTKKVLQYELRDVKFITPLVVPESGSVEIQLQLILVEGSQWDDFVVYGTEESDTVIEYCRGSAMATLQPEIDEVEGTRELSQAEETHSQYLKDVQGMSLNPVDTKSFYQAAREKGNSYGPHFACMKSMSLKGTQALSTFEVPDIAECMPGGTMQSHLVHPAVLDSFLHPPIALANIDNTSGSVVTASIGHLVVSPDLQSTAGSLLDSCTKLTDQWGQVCTADLDIFQSGAAGKAQPVVHIHDLRLQDIGFTGPSEESTKRDIVYIQKCGLDADYATAEDVDPFKSDMDTATESQASKVSALNSIAAYFINRTVEILDDDDSIKVATHYQRLVDWLRRFRKTQEFREIVNGRPLDSDVEDVVKDTQSLGVEGEVLAIIGQKLISVITGEIEPLSLFTEKGLLWRLYADDASARGYDISIEYLRHLVFKDPNMTVLEIGAGTGGATEPILQALAADSFPFESYDFTDISASFFEKSRERLKKWEKNMRYRKLNLQEDLVSQGYQEGSYDLIMASNVLHVAHDISQALTRIRKLLRPGGRILMIETTVTVPWLQFSIGVLPGWWGAEDGRINGPLLSEDEWDEKLKQNGLEGISVVGKDFEGPAHRCSMIVSKPLPMNDLQESQHLPIEIVLPPCWVDAQPALVQSLIDSMKKDGRNVTTTPLEGIESSSEKLYLVLDSGDAPVLAERDASLFQSITGLLTSPATLLWLSVQEKSSNVGNGKKNLITGVLRSARTENRSLRAYTLNVQDEIYEPQSVAGLVQVVSGLVQKMRLPDQTQPNMEFDSIYRGGQVFIERVLPDKQLDHSFAKSLGTAAVERQKFHQEGRPLKLSVKKTRIIDKMKFEVDLSIQGPLSPGIVEVRVEAFGINFKDVLIAGGHPKKKLSMAGEFAGVVVGVGADCQGYDIGDRVCGFGATPYASRIRVLGESIAKLPSDLTTCAGATIPVVFATAYHSLVDVARLEKGQTVLIHSAAGGVGQAAIAIAHWIGAEVFATVSNATKKDFLKQQFGLADDHIFSSKLRTFKDGINRLTGGKGVDVVLNSLSGQLLQDSLACVSRFGTFVEIGKTDIHAGSRLSLTPFDTNITLASVDLSLIQEHRPTKSGQLIRKVVSLIAEGQLKLPSFQTRPLEEISAAFISLQNRTHMGKIVLEAGEDAIAEAPPMQANFPLSSDATYVIAGGRGGLGRELAKRLANNGAKHLVLLSRRAVTSEEEEEISKTFGPMQTNVRVLSCDISNKASVQDSLPKCLEDMPPVRGVIQSTMVDHYALLQKMTVEDFRIGTEAKVDGTENLLKVLSNHPMDFFMMMSSLIGGTSGTTGQANYGAANAYLAGLTTSPMHSQTRFVAICPGVVEDVGILAGDEDVLDLSRRQGFITMQSKEAFALFDYAMSQEATSRGVNLITSGFDYESFAFAKSGRQDVLDNPLFSHVPRNDSKREGNNSEKTAGNIHELLANASSKSEADILIAQAIAKKVQTLVANEDDIDTSSKLVNLGIDSLTLVELKNWFVQTFQVRLQTSDIYDAPSIVHLAAVVATRSPKLNFEESSVSTPSFYQ
jgi:acyl transferase domain-containing protein/NADPH:quinone reductase-like Zn-dependent oxidoreductase/NAD(P)-dependent dehydrogenase (short-subunit alcohol dehydrogenase family)/SAM-dependent methyltransferase/acyl carrier protein